MDGLDKYTHEYCTLSNTLFRIGACNIEVEKLTSVIISLVLTEKKQ